MGVFFVCFFNLSVSLKFTQVVSFHLVLTVDIIGSIQLSIISVNQKDNFKKAIHICNCLAVGLALVSV